VNGKRRGVKRLYATDTASRGSEALPKRIPGIAERRETAETADNDAVGARSTGRGKSHPPIIALKFLSPRADERDVIEGIHIPDIARLVKPAPSSEERQQQPQRRRQQHQRDNVPKPRVYAPNGQVDEQEPPKIDLVG
jgi:hypothetical protein